MYKKIINPKTKRKVSIYSRTGRLILHKYLEQIGGNEVKSNFYRILIYLFFILKF